MRGRGARRPAANVGYLALRPYARTCLLGKMTYSPAARVAMPCTADPTAANMPSWSPSIGRGRWPEKVSSTQSSEMRAERWPSTWLAFTSMCTLSDCVLLVRWSAGSLGGLRSFAVRPDAKNAPMTMPLASQSTLLYACRPEGISRSDCLACGLYTRRMRPRRGYVRSHVYSIYTGCRWRRGPHVPLFYCQ
jgi:hypothetical protein